MASRHVRRPAAWRPAGAHPPIAALGERVFRNADPTNVIKPGDQARAVFTQLTGWRQRVPGFVVPVMRLNAGSFAGPRRCHPAPIALTDLPDIDAVVISHDHYDHLDMPTVRARSRATRGARFVVPLGWMNDSVKIM